MPRRIQRRRTKGWRMPAGAVYVGRPTKWGNPWKPLDFLGAKDLVRGRVMQEPVDFVLRAVARWLPRVVEFKEVDAQSESNGMFITLFVSGCRVAVSMGALRAAVAVEKYRRWLEAQLWLEGKRVRLPSGRAQPALTQDLMREELRGRDLVCWCPLDQPCHADVLLELANG